MVNSANYQTLLELRLWLKIGLAQEKKGSYDAASLAYQEAIQIADNFFDQAIEEAKDSPKGPKRRQLENLNHFRLLFQPHLCQAYLLEKSATNVHTSFDLIESFLEKLRTLLQLDAVRNLPNFPLFCTDCQMKAANLYYFKGFTPYHSQHHLSDDYELQFINKAEALYFEAIRLLLQTYFYGMPIELTEKRYFKLIEILTEIFFFGGVQPVEKGTIAPSVQVFQMLANAVSDLSNVLMAKTGKSDTDVKISMLSSFLVSWRSLQQSTRDALKELITNCKVPGPWNALGMNLLASRIFLWASMHKEAAFEYEKIIQRLRYCNIDFIHATYQDIIEILKMMKLALYDPGIRHYYRAYLNTSARNDDPVFSRSPNLAIDPPEVENLTIYWLRLQDRFIKKSKHKVTPQKEKIIQYIEKISPEDVFDNVKIRIDRLNLKVNKLNDWFQEQLEKTQEQELKKAIKKMIKENPGLQEKLFLIIRDGLFCCYNSISLREIHSNTYWWLHLGRAFMHYFLAQWLQRWKAYFEAINADSETEKQLMNYLGVNNMQIEQQLQMALENFHQVKETHTNGQAYKTLINKMYFLNNDFNDRAYHFHLAHERAQLRRGKVEGKTREVERQMLGEWPRKPMDRIDLETDARELNEPT